MSFVSEGIGDDGPDGNPNMGADDPLAAMRTNAQARNVLGLATLYLRKAYEIASKQTNLAKLKKNTIELLDRQRAFVEKVYRNIPSDSAQLSPANRKKVLVGYRQTVSNLQLIENVGAKMKQSFVSDVLDSLAEKAKSIATALPSVSSISKTLFWIGGIGVVGGIGWWVYSSRSK